MPVVGTAGHVDHGKSTLTLALSGRDPDRWAEEKDRGLTIDLGFAWTTLPDGTEISFVDVPGHERYSKNMLAGIEAIDVALLVVAADEGWMPQSEEHLAVLDLLGVTHGVVALSKVDRVDHELAELAGLEVEERLEGTSLEGAPIVQVSGVTGDGLDVLREALVRAVAASNEPAGDRPRLWIDRAFSAQGAGTIVTGTLLGGPLSIDDRLTAWPARTDVRIRGIESHEASRESVEPRRRVALNVAGAEPHEVGRGTMLGQADQWRTTTSVAVALRMARYAEPISNRGAFHIHVGSGSWPVRVRVVDDDVAIIDLPVPLALSMGDRFIVRDTGRRQVIAGGRVIDPEPPRANRLRPHAPALRGSLDGGSDARATALLGVRGRSDPAVLAIHSGGGTPTGAVDAGGLLLTPDTAAAIGSGLERMVADFHDQHPLRPGVPVAEAASRLGVDSDVLGVIIDRSDLVESDGTAVRSTGRTAELSADQEAAWAGAEKRLAESGTAVPRVDELGLETELVHALVRRGDLVRISSEFVFLPGQIEELAAEVKSMPGPFTVSEFKDATGLSRKYAVPFLEWADDSGLTVRMGDRRRART